MRPNEIVEAQNNDEKTEYWKFTMSKFMYSTVGNTIIEWEEDSPLQWTMRESLPDGTPSDDSINCDFSALASGYEEEFLFGLKDILISLLHRVQLSTIAVYCKHIRLILVRMLDTDADERALIPRIDGKFIVALRVLKPNVPRSYLQTLKRLHKTNRDNERLFEKGLLSGDFPDTGSKRGATGDRINSIIAKALSRSTLVHIST